jgi:hypothetical protein
MVGGASTTEDAGMSEYRVRNLADSTTFIEREGVSFMTDLARSDADALVPCSAIRKQSRRSMLALPMAGNRSPTPSPRRWAGRSAKDTAGD